ncbi:MAG: hypothetical protein EA405_02135 [Rhodospirillales bacterium]|nr:MAG: hypothetical protein EA405_02135 [Rhodospirillales bacterium]
MWQTCAGLVAAVAIVVSLIGWRLAQGPVSLPLLTPLAERLVAARIAPFGIGIADTRLSWEGWDDAFDLRLIDIQLTGPGGDALVQAPALAATLSPRALLRGVVVPGTLRLFEPRFAIRRDADGLALIVPDDAGEHRFRPADLDLPEHSANTTGLAGFLGHLRRVEIVDAHLRFDDVRLGISVVVPDATLQVWRDGKAIRVAADLALVGADPEEAGPKRAAAEVSIKGRYVPETARLDIGAVFADFRPAVFSHSGSGPATIGGIDLPLSGTVMLDLTSAGGLVGAGLDITGGAGTLVIPGDLMPGAADDPHPTRVPIAGINLRGGLDADQGVLWIGDLALDFGEQGHVRLPEPLDHDLPMRRLSLRGQYGLVNQDLRIDDLQADLHGPRLAGHAIVDAAADIRRIRVAAALQHLGVDELSRYWPPPIKPGTRKWMTGNLAAGRFPRAAVSLDLREDASGHYHVHGLAGTAELVGARVRYLPSMPPVEAASGHAIFDTEAVTITLDGGRWNSLRVTAGTIRFDDLSAARDRADIRLTVEGPLRDHLSLIDHPPLGYAQKIGIRPDAVSGAAVVRLAIGFPLLADLSFDDVAIRADADAEAVTVTDAILGRDLTQGRLTLFVDKDGLKLNGSGALGGVAGTFEARETFDRSREILRTVTVTIPSADVAQAQEVIFGRTLLAEAMAGGSLAAVVTATETSAGQGALTATLDLAPLALNVPALMLNKPSGATGTAEIALTMQDGRVAEVNADAFLAGGTHRAGGTVRFSADQAVESVEITTLVAGRTDARGHASALADGGWAVHIRGNSLDLAPMLEHLRRPSAGPAVVGEERELRLTADIGSIWLGEDRRLHDLAGSLTQIGPRLSRVNARANTTAGSRLTTLLQPDDRGHRHLLVTADDAGDALRTLGLFDAMTGGHLTLDATFADHRPSRALEGRLLVRDYTVTGAPFIAHLLSVMALTGIESALRGEGLAFSVLDVPFTYSGDLLEFTNARASGLSLGITASGRAALEAGTVDVRGTVVPLYAVNATLGRIPVLGNLLTGGEQGGGVFAATYRATGSLDDPHISVNPLAALAPGFVRNIFGALAGTTVDGGKLPLEPADSVR